MTPTAFLQKEKTASFGSTGLPSPKSIDGSKTDQTSAEYRADDVRCSLCVHFDGVDTCSKVDGEISPDGNSRFFERQEENTEKEAPEGEPSELEQD